MEMQQRLEKLEKERWVYLGMGFLAVIAGLLGAIVGAGLTGGGGSVLRAQQIVLRGSGEAIIVEDSDGKPRLSVRLNDKGLPAMEFYDAESKKPRQIIGLSANAKPQVVLLDEKGQRRAEFNINDEGLPKMAFLDDLSTRRQQVGLESGGAPLVEFFDLNNNPQASLDGDALKFFRGGRPVYTAPPLPGPPQQPRPQPANTKK